ncbi:hypothetical protein LJR225_000074 [Phenylobacterium sp. LjRoot225]|uniref:hypothetical protein n=1 Tax=Phenylobacterium sp. LjRoot225 TaxID=3342285 RepID=UPI003ECD3FBE
MTAVLVDAGLHREIASSLVASLASGVRHDQPYPNWRLSRLFPEAVARALAALAFDAPDVGAPSGKRELHSDHRHYFAGRVLDHSPIIRGVAQAFQAPQVVRAMADLIGAELDRTFLRIEYALDVEGFWLEPHTDLGVKALTLLIQLPAEGQGDLGTDLYERPGAWRDRAAFEWNAALLFVPSDNTWHGFEPRPITGVRRSVIVNYVSDDWRAREQLAFPDEPVSLR